MEWEFLPNVCLGQLSGLIEMLSVAPAGGSA